MGCSVRSLKHSLRGAEGCIRRRLDRPSIDADENQARLAAADAHAEGYVRATATQVAFADPFALQARCEIRA